MLLLFAPLLRSRLLLFLFSLFPPFPIALLPLMLFTLLLLSR